MCHHHSRFYLFAAVVLLISMCLLPLTAGSAASSITTLYDGGNGYHGNMFDITVLSGGNVEITSFDVNLETFEIPLKVSVYYREGSYVGYEADSSAWTLAGSDTVTAQGEGNPTPVSVGSIWLTSGKTYGFYITLDSTDRSGHMFYTENSTTYENADLKLTLGAGLGHPIFTHINGARVWNGTIYYNLHDVPQTGDASTPFLWLALALTALTGGTAAALWRRRQARRS